MHRRQQVFPTGKSTLDSERAIKNSSDLLGEGESVWGCCQPSNTASEVGRDEGDSNELEKRPLPKWIENERLIRAW